jgi:hypothetical protein
LALGVDAVTGAAGILDAGAAAKEKPAGAGVVPVVLGTTADEVPPNNPPPVLGAGAGFEPKRPPPEGAGAKKRVRIYEVRKHENP